MAWFAVRIDRGLQSPHSFRLSSGCVMPFYLSVLISQAMLSCDGRKIRNLHYKSCKQPLSWESSHPFVSGSLHLMHNGRRSKTLVIITQLELNLTILAARVLIPMCKTTRPVLIKKKKQRMPFKHLFLQRVFNTKSDYSALLFTLIVWQMSRCKSKSLSCTSRTP